MAIVTLTEPVKAARCQQECDAELAGCYAGCQGYGSECLQECDASYSYCSYGAHTCPDGSASCFSWYHSSPTIHPDYTHEVFWCTWEY
jgi:hypothetical protein